MIDKTTLKQNDYKDDEISLVELRNILVADNKWVVLSVLVY